MHLLVLLQSICLAAEVQPTHIFVEQVTCICVIQTLFSLHPLVIVYETSNLYEMISKSKITAIAICLIIFGAYITRLFIIKLKIYVLIYMVI